MAWLKLYFRIHWKRQKWRQRKPLPLLTEDLGPGAGPWLRRWLVPSLGALFSGLGGALFLISEEVQMCLFLACQRPLS